MKDFLICGEEEEGGKGGWYSLLLLPVWNSLNFLPVFVSLLTISRVIRQLGAQTGTSQRKLGRSHEILVEKIDDWISQKMCFNEEFYQLWRQTTMLLLESQLSVPQCLQLPWFFYSLLRWTHPGALSAETGEGTFCIHTEYLLANKVGSGFEPRTHAPLP